MTLLRDLRETTKLLILMEIVKREHSKLRTLAEKFEMSVQGMSEYLKMMTSEGMVHHIGGVYRPTKKGVQFLHDRFSELKRFIESSAKELAIIDVCGAIAASDIEKGQKVGLFMEGGYLVADPERNSSSTGRALISARRGQDVAVTELEGITKHNLGKVIIARIPGIRRGGSRKANLTKLRSIIEKEEPDLIAVSDASGKAVSNALQLKPDIEFASLVASIEASERGLSVLYLCSQESYAEALAHLRERNENSEDKIAFEVVSLEE